MSELNNKTSRTSQKDEWRCDCGRLLFKGEFMLGIIEVKCPRCKRIVYLQEHNIFTVGQESFMVVVDPTSGLVLSSTEGVKRVLGLNVEDANGTVLKSHFSEDFKTVIDFWLTKVAGFKGKESDQLTSTAELIAADGSVVEVSFLAKAVGLSGRPLIFCVVEKGYEHADRFKERFSAPQPQPKPAGQVAYQYHAWDFLIDEEGIVKFVSPENILGFGEEKVSKDLFGIFSGLEAEKVRIMKLMRKGTSTVESTDTVDAKDEKVSLDISFRTKTEHMIGEGMFTIALLKK